MSNEVTYPGCIFWKPSIKAIGFRCNNCLTLLWDMDEATSDLVIENKPLNEDPVCFCKKCGNVVAQIKEVKEKNNG